MVPGRWSERELDFHAEHIATMLTNNAGFNCTASRVIVTAARWPQRDALMDRIRRQLGGLPTRLAYYPGSAERFGAFQAVHPDAELFGDAGEGHLPWMLIAGLSPDAVDDPCYSVEAFCSITAETPIDAPDAATFLDRTTAFLNERVWGTLNATVIVDPRTARDPAVAPALDRAVDRLRYGTVALNYWSAAGFAMGITPWGAAPGNPRNAHRVGDRVRAQPADVRAGREDGHPGAVRRLAQAAVVLVPPARARPMMQELARFEADRRPSRLLPVAWDALRG